MKKLLTLFALLAMFVFASCEENGSDNIDPNDKTENKIASVEEQMEAIRSSLPSLKAAVTATKNLVNSLSPNNVAPANVTLMKKANDNSNNGVKTQIAELEKRIEELEKYIANGGATNQEWLDMTYATLDMYEEVINLLAALQTEVDVLKEQISSNNYELFTQVDAKLNESLDSMKGWVSEQLSGYYDIAEVDALFAQMEASLTEDDAELRSAMDKLREDIGQTLSDMREEYKAAIAEAINENNGVITAAIAEEIAAVNARIDSEISALNKRIDDIEARLEELENAVSNLINRIQSITYVPTHEDGNARVDCHNASIEGSTMEMSFIISPTNAVADIVENYEDILTLKANTVGTTSFVNLPITTCTADTENGVLSITAECDNLGEDFFLMRNSAKAMLTISDGNNNRNTEYISLCPRYHQLADHIIMYTTTDGKKININWNKGYAHLLSNTYEDGVGLLTFDSIPSIPDEIFKDCSTLQTITSTYRGIRNIGSYAFSGCSSLEKVEMNIGCVLGDYAFDACERLSNLSFCADEIHSLLRIGKGAFRNCRSLANITIPSNYKSIACGQDAFQECVSLPVEDNVRYAGTYAIEVVDNTISSCSLKEGTRFIGEYCFFFCQNLTNISIPDSVTSIGSSAFYDCFSLTSISIPEGVSSIGSSAFCDCFSLTSISIPDSVTEIGEDAFCGCSSLASVTIPDSVTSIGRGAFAGCSSLASITIPEGVTSIKMEAFYGCSSLASVTIPDSVTSIDRGAFAGCSSLASITIPEGVTSIKMEAFYGCSSLESITIPESVTSIENGTFAKCSNLTSIDIPEGVTSIESSAFSGCSSLASINIPDSVTSIGMYAFYNCTSLASITIPNSVTSIESSAFSGCSSLASITIPEGVTSIGSSAFSGCSSLASITIPEGVTSIGWCAFYYCASLVNVYCEPTTPPTAYAPQFGSWLAFEPNTEVFKIHVPTESVEAYKAAEGWSEYADYIVGYDFE